MDALRHPAQVVKNQQSEKRRKGPYHFNLKTVHSLHSNAKVCSKETVASRTQALIIERLAAASTHCECEKEENRATGEAEEPDSQS